MNSDENRSLSLTVDDVSDYLESPALVYFSKTLGIEPPRVPTHPLEKAVRKLLMKEFDIHRADQSVHPIMKEYGIDALPFSHEELPKWRTTAHGLTAYHGPSSTTISGRIDDLWHTPDKRLILVEYAPIGEANAQLPQRTITKIELFAWMLSQKGFGVAHSGYLVQCIGLSDKVAFDARIEFSLKLHAHQLDTTWIEPRLMEIARFLSGPRPELDESVPLHKYLKSMMALLESHG